MSTKPYWLTSQRSQNGLECVELSRDLKHIRDSKDPHGPVLTVNVPAFVQAIRQGRFDR